MTLELKTALNRQGRNRRKNGFRACVRRDILWQEEIRLKPKGSILFHGGNYLATSSMGVKGRWEAALSQRNLSETKAKMESLSYGAAVSGE